MCKVTLKNGILDDNSWTISRNAEKAFEWYEDNMLKGNYSK